MRLYLWALIVVICIGSVFMFPWSLLIQTNNGNGKAMDLIKKFCYFLSMPQFISLTIATDIPSIFHPTQTLLLLTGGKGSPWEQSYWFGSIQFVWLNFHSLLQRAWHHLALIQEVLAGKEKRRDLASEELESESDFSHNLKVKVISLTTWKWKWFLSQLETESYFSHKLKVFKWQPPCLQCPSVSLMKTGFQENLALPSLIRTPVVICCTTFEGYLISFSA